MANFLGKNGTFVINHPVSMDNVDLKKLFDIDLRFLLLSWLIFEKFKTENTLGRGLNSKIHPKMTCPYMYTGTQL